MIVEPDKVLAKIPHGTGALQMRKMATFAKRKRALLCGSDITQNSGKRKDNVKLLFYGEAP
jgi:hypothetical protein